MTPQEWNEGLNHLDMDLIEDHILMQDKLRRGNRTNRLWLRLGTAAACLSLLAGVFFLSPRPGIESPEPTAVGSEPLTTQPSLPQPFSPDILLPAPPLEFDTFAELSGSSLEFVRGSSTEVVSGEQAEPSPPEFQFIPYEFTAQVRAVESYPDTYYKLDVNSTYKPIAYRLVCMEVLQTLHGENLPRYFLYLLPETLYVDLSVYDSLLIAMSQLGTENYVLRNGTQNRMEACPLPLFSDCQGKPELGNVIAFTDGIFDESLWQNESWRYGYQFGQYYLDNPQHGNLVVRRGSSLEETIAEINRRLESYRRNNSHLYHTPTVISWAFETQSAREVLEFVKPFENGVFSQLLDTWNTGGQLTFRRYINGCQTEETITVDLVTENVTYSQVRYTAQDLTNLQNIALYLQEKAAEYAQSLPTPPHTDPEGKTLLCLNLYAWYAKVDGKLYGVVKTAWRYSQKEDWFIQYYDDQYVLFDMTADSARDIPRDELLALLGNRNVYTGPYGLEQNMPMH